MKRAPDWRDVAAGGLLAKHVHGLVRPGRALVMEDPRDEAAAALARAGVEVERWWRRAAAGHGASAWPPPGPFVLVALRLPRAKDELEMAVHAAAGALAPGGTLVVYGARDEGIGSAGRRIEGVVAPVRTLATGGHCRLLTVERPSNVAGLRASLDDWRAVTPLQGHPRWVSYPGVFAHGRLDRGTALLLEHLPDPDTGDRILDFGCGSGLIAETCLRRARAKGRHVTVDGSDVDAVALAAFRENVPEARGLLACGPGELADRSYTRIVSNPPYHHGKPESTGTVEALIREGPRLLEPGGSLALVVQRRLPVQAMLGAAFPSVRSLAADGTYQVWEARTR